MTYHDMKEKRQTLNRFPKSHLIGKNAVLSKCNIILSCTSPLTNSKIFVLLKIVQDVAIRIVYSHGIIYGQNTNDLNVCKRL